MTTFDIYIAFVSWSGGGKNRPVLILEDTTRNVTALSITSRYDNKSKEIRDNYFLISDWDWIGYLYRYWAMMGTPSSDIIKVAPVEKAKERYIGYHTMGTQEAISRFIHEYSTENRAS